MLHLFDKKYSKKVYCQILQFKINVFYFNVFVIRYSAATTLQCHVMLHMLIGTQETFLIVTNVENSSYFLQKLSNI